MSLDVGTPKGLTLQSVLSLYWPDHSERKVRILRHRHKNLDAISADKEIFREYQGFQAGPKFGNSEFVVSFVAREGRTCEFRGIYKVEACIKRGSKNAAFPSVSSQLQRLDPNSIRDCDHFYDLNLTTLAQELVGRLRIDWASVGKAKASQNWTQNLATQDKPVTEIRPVGFAMEFPGFDRILLTRMELLQLFKPKQSTSGNIWKDLMSRVAAVYLITTGSGDQYVGSAYGKQALWGRWNQYANDPSGGNIKLKKLIEKNPEIVDSFRYSVLSTLPFALDKGVVIQTENWFKTVLGSRAQGLNAN